MPAHADRKWLALALLCASQFMVVLDVSIVNVALPSIEKGLHFTQGNLQWVLSAYTLVFGGFLMLGGRAADLLGRRVVFMVGLSVFTLASLACGLATSEGFLIAARAVQGLGAAIISPAALSIVMTTFEEGAERNKALGIWGALGGAGAAAGVLAGGVLTSWLGWAWIFFVNVPVGAAAIAFSPVLLRESRADLGHRRFDAAGAVTVTAGLSLLVYAVVTTNKHHWGSGTTIGLLAGAAALLVAFLGIESRAPAPLMPLGFFRNRTVSGANAVGFVLGGSIFAMFFFLSLYMQQILHYSALKAGVAYLAIALTVIVVAGISQALVTKLGVKTVLVSGMLLLAAAQVWFARLPVGGRYAIDLLPGFLVAAFGLGFSFIPVSIASLAGVAARDAGLASGLINTSQQIGGALGIAIISTVATTHTAHLLGSGDALAPALNGGFRYAFAVTAGFALAGALLGFGLIRKRDVETVESAPVADAA